MSTDDTNAARRWSGSNDLLGPLPAPDLQADPCSADGTQTDYYTAGTVRRLLAAERDRCAKLADDFANRAWNDARSEAWSDEFELLARNIRGA